MIITNIPFKTFKENVIIDIDSNSLAINNVIHGDTKSDDTLYVKCEGSVSLLKLGIDTKEQFTISTFVSIKAKKEYRNSSLTKSFSLDNYTVTENYINVNDVYINDIFKEIEKIATKKVYHKIFNQRDKLSKESVTSYDNRNTHYCSENEYKQYIQSRDSLTSERDVNVSSDYLNLFKIKTIQNDDNISKED